MVNLKYKYVFSDLDDTLSTCQENYDKNSEKVISLINKYTGIKSENILSIYDEIKIDLAKKIGYSKSRYPVSWLETYFKCQLISKKEINMREIKTVYNTANSIHMAKVKLFPGTKEAIIKMKENGIKLYIVTAGDATSQNRKIDMLGIREYFDICYVLKEKTSSTMSEILGTKDRTRCVMIGNSKKSDILPAYANNVFGIRIKRDTWSYEEAELPDRGFIEVNDFSEASQHILNLYE